MRPLIRPSSSRARSTHVTAPRASKPSSAASIVSRAARLCRARLRVVPSASCARARPNRLAELLVARDGFFQQRHRLGDGPARGGHEAAAARYGGEDVALPTRAPSRSHRSNNNFRLVTSVELEQRLDELRRPGSRVCRAPPERLSLVIGPGKSLDARRRVAAPERDDSRHGLEERRMEPDLLLAQPQRALRLPLPHARVRLGTRRSTRSGCSSDSARRRIER